MNKNKISLIDSHSHLDLMTNPDRRILEAQSKGISHIITIGIDLNTSKKAYFFSKKFNNVFYTAGIHPHNAKNVNKRTLLKVKKIAQKGAIGWGECGLDFYKNKSPKKKQLEVFKNQIELALELKIPLIIHDREAHSEVYNILKNQNANKVGGIIHCFSGDLKMAYKFIGLGFSIGIGGTLSYPKNENLRKIIQEIPLKNIILETDAPFLAPQPKRGLSNEPAYLIYTCKILAQTLKKEILEVASIIKKNTFRIFNIYK